MNEELKDMEEEKQKLKEIIKQINEEENRIETILSNSDMNYDLENIAKARVLQAQVKKLEDIKNIKNKPYFARMDFKENNKDIEKFYIGKISLLDNKTSYPIIVDWRAPISNLYYEGKIGKASYECLGNEIQKEFIFIEE